MWTPIHPFVIRFSPLCLVFRCVFVDVLIFFFFFFFFCHCSGHFTLVAPTRHPQRSCLSVRTPVWPRQTCRSQMQPRMVRILPFFILCTLLARILGVLSYGGGRPKECHVMACHNRIKPVPFVAESMHGVYASLMNGAQSAEDATLGILRGAIDPAPEIVSGSLLGPQGTIRSLRYYGSVSEQMLECVCTCARPTHKNQVTCVRLIEN